MTAVTDQNHTEYTDHMRRTDHGSGSGDTGSSEHSAHSGSGAMDTAERAGSLPQARPSLVKEPRGADRPRTDRTDRTDRTADPRPAGITFSEGQGQGRSHGRRDEKGIQEEGPYGDGGRGADPAASRGGAADGDQDEGRGRGGDFGGGPHARVGSGEQGESGQKSERSRSGEHGRRDEEGLNAGKGDGKGERGEQGLGEDGSGDRERPAREQGENAERDRPARGPGSDEGVSVPRPQSHSQRSHSQKSQSSKAEPRESQESRESPEPPESREPRASRESHSPKPRPAADATPPKAKVPPTASASSSTASDTGASSTEPGKDADPGSSESWDDGLIARRVTEATSAALAAERASAGEQSQRAPGSHTPAPLAYDGPLRSRLDALRELVGLSRTRLDGHALAEAGRVLDEAAARRKLSGRHTVVALAGATGSGKSQLFNALAGVPISETGVRRPTTAAPIACSWSDGAAALIDRLGIPGRLRRRPLHSPDTEGQLRGLVLIDLPDHDSAAVQHREQVDRILKLVDAVIWVVDPEKYADAVLHERYLRPMSGHAEIMFIVLNQVDRLPGDAADQVLDDLRRLLDEDGIALGEHGEPGATVLALSALTGDGVGDLGEVLGQFVAERGAAARRVAADVDAAAAELRPVYAAGRRVGLSEDAREEFAARLADAVGATAAGEAAERAWLRNANRACGTPWLRLWRWYQGRGESTTGRIAVRGQADEEATARQRVEQAVRTVADRASAGLPTPWAQAVREAAVRGSQGLSEALDDLAARAGLPPGRPLRPGWWPVAVLVQAAMTLLQIVGGAWLAGQIAGVMAPNLGVPVLLMVSGIVGGPLVEWGCRMAARGPARRYGQEAERRLRETAASCGRARVLDPVASELLRYREVREQYGRVVRAGVR
ncbi:YfjP family GTPase [Streptomyces rameus]|uniref:YfjP family GTPase n=1 Tax=Streptomyces rameus TaxID=68261 RepID=A0ABP6MU99_9ACTN